MTDDWVFLAELGTGCGSVGFGQGFTTGLHIGSSVWLTLVVGVTWSMGYGRFRVVKLGV